MANTNSEHEDQFKKTPLGVQERWNKEIEGARRRGRRYRIRGNKIIRRFIDDRGLGSYGWSEGGGSNWATFFRLNLFNTNVSTLASMLYGRLPKVDVSRRHHDAEDDVARVAAVILGRMLNNSVQEQGEEFASVLKGSLLDRLLPGMGLARIRYDMASETTEIQIQGIDEETGEMTEETIEQDKLLYEDAPIDYVHWDDFLWSWGRIYEELTWVAFRSYLTKEQVKERFGNKIADSINYTNQTPIGSKDADDVVYDRDLQDVWSKAEIWEIWSKEDSKVYWWSHGQAKILDEQDDPLQLEQFFPIAPPMIANPTTNYYLPTADFWMAQDLYGEIDVLSTRIAIITRAVKVVGVYDQSAVGVERMFNEGVDNDLIPVENWAMFAEKGGLKGVVDWFPVETVVLTLSKLQEMRQETIQLLYQVTGMSDILRGQSDQYTAASSDQLKAKFASIRVQALQDDFAGFASNLMVLRAEIISKFFDAETIIQQSGIMNTPDKEYIQPAIELIKNWEATAWRIEIKPESVAMVDYAQLKQERVEFITAMATFMQSSAPLIEQDPEAAPFLMQLLKWTLAGFKGAQEIEGVVDRAMDSMQKRLEQKQGQPEEKDPAEKVAEIRAQGEQQKIQGEMALEKQKHQQDMQQMMQDFQNDMQKIKADFESDMLVMKVKTGAKVTEEEMQAYYAIIEEEAKTELKIVGERATRDD